MVNVYVDADGAVRSAVSDKIIAPPGMTPAAARMRAHLWAAAASALAAATAATPTEGEGMTAVAAPTPISAAPSYARTVAEAREVLAVIDVAQMQKYTARALATLAAHSPQEGQR